jgi:hypothetical protein
MVDDQKKILMAGIGYQVHQRSSHVGPKWDYATPHKQGPMNSRMFASEDLAYVELEQVFDRDVMLAGRLLAYISAPTLLHRCLVEMANLDEKIAEQPWQNIKQVLLEAAATISALTALVQGDKPHG